MTAQVLRHDEIARTAYALWESAGRPTGRDLEFWTKAESDLRRQRGLPPADMETDRMALLRSMNEADERRSDPVRRPDRPGPSVSRLAEVQAHSLDAHASRRTRPTRLAKKCWEGKDLR